MLANAKVLIAIFIHGITLRCLMVWAVTTIAFVMPCVPSLKLATMRSPINATCISSHTFIVQQLRAN